MSSEALASIRQSFFDECVDHLNEFEAGLIALDAGERDPDTVNAVFRAAHSIKGGAAIFGLEVLARCAHAAETVLSGMRDSGEIPPVAVATLPAAPDGANGWFRGPVALSFTTSGADCATVTRTRRRNSLPTSRRG